MSITVDILQVEMAINRWSSARSADSRELSEAEQLLAEVYGRMIHARLRSIDLALLTPAQRALLRPPPPAIKQPGG